MGFTRLVWSSFGYTFGQQLRRVRRNRGISQQALAELSGVSRNQISNLERNDNNATTMADPQLSTVYKLAFALEVPPAVLLPSVDLDAVECISHVAPFPRSYVDGQRFQASVAAGGGTGRTPIGRITN